MWVSLLLQILVPIAVKLLQDLLVKYGTSVDLAKFKDQFVSTASKGLLGKLKADTAGKLWDLIVSLHSQNLARPVVAMDKPADYASMLVKSAVSVLKKSL